MFRHRTVAGMAPSSRYLEKECPPILEMTSEKCVTAFAERTAITSGRARRAPNRMAAGQCCSATLLPHSRRSVRGSTPRWSPPLCSTASLPNLEWTRRTWSGLARRCRTVRAEWKPESQEVTWISPAQALRDSITGEQRAAVLQIKDVWFRLSSYPDQVGGFDVYIAVMDDGVRTPEEVRRWLAGRGLPQA